MGVKLPNKDITVQAVASLMTWVVWVYAEHTYAGSPACAPFHTDMLLMLRKPFAGVCHWYRHTLGRIYALARNRLQYTRECAVHAALWHAATTFCNIQPAWPGLASYAKVCALATAHGCPLPRMTRGGSCPCVVAMQTPSAPVSPSAGASPSSSPSTTASETSTSTVSHQGPLSAVQARCQWE